MLYTKKYSPTYKKEISEVDSYSSPLTNYVEKRTINNIDYTRFYTSVDTNLSVDDRVYIVNGNYDTYSIIEQNPYRMGTYGYKILEIDNCSITLEIEWTGELPYTQDDYDNFIKITPCFDYDQLNYEVATNGFFPYKYQLGERYNNNILYHFIQDKFYVAKDFSDNSGSSYPYNNDINNWLEVTEDVENNTINDINGFYQNNNRILPTEDFTYNGVNFKKDVVYIFDEDKELWVLDKKYLKPYLSLGSFRKGRFNGEWKDGIFGNDETVSKWGTEESKWESGIFFNSLWESGEVQSKSDNDNRISNYSNLNEKGEITLSKDKNNNGGKGYNFFDLATFEYGTIYNGNFHNCDIGTYFTQSSVIKRYTYDENETFEDLSVTIKDGKYSNSDIIGTNITNGSFEISDISNSKSNGGRYEQTDIDLSIIKGEFDGLGNLDIISYDRVINEENTIYGTYSNVFGDTTKVVNHKFYLSEKDWTKIKNSEKSINLTNLITNKVEPLDIFDNNFYLKSRENNPFYISDNYGEYREVHVKLTSSKSNEYIMSDGEVSLNSNALPSIDVFIKTIQDRDFLNTLSIKDITNSNVQIAQLNKSIIEEGTWKAYKINNPDFKIKRKSDKSLDITLNSNNNIEVDLDIISTIESFQNDININDVVFIDKVISSSASVFNDISGSYNIESINGSVLELSEINTNNLSSVAQGSVFYTNSVINPNTNLIDLTLPEPNYTSIFTEKILNSNVNEGFIKRAIINNSEIYNESFVETTDYTNKDLTKLVLSEMIMDSDNELDIKSSLFIRSSLRDVTINNSVITTSVMNGTIFNSGLSDRAKWLNGTFNAGRFFGSDRKIISDENDLYKNYLINRQGTDVKSEWTSGTFNFGEMFNSIWFSGTFNTGKFYDSIFAAGIWNNGEFGDRRYSDKASKFGEKTISAESILAGNQEPIWYNGNFVNGEFGIKEQPEFDGTQTDVYCTWDSGIFRNGILQGYGEKGTTQATTIWNNGEFNNGDVIGHVAWYDGQFNNGRFTSVFGDGYSYYPWIDGTFNGGEFGNDKGKILFNEQTYHNSTWKDGKFTSGDFYGKIWNDGTFNGGNFWGRPYVIYNSTKKQKIEDFELDFQVEGNISQTKESTEFNVIWNEYTGTKIPNGFSPDKSAGVPTPDAILLPFSQNEGGDTIVDGTPGTLLPEIYTETIKGFEVNGNIIDCGCLATRTKYGEATLNYELKYETENSVVKTNYKLKNNYRSYRCQNNVELGWPLWGTDGQVWFEDPLNVSDGHEIKMLNGDIRFNVNSGVYDNNGADSIVRSLFNSKYYNVIYFDKNNTTTYGSEINFDIRVSLNLRKIKIPFISLSGTWEISILNSAGVSLSSQIINNDSSNNPNKWTEGVLDLELSSSTQINEDLTLNFSFTQANQDENEVVFYFGDFIYEEVIFDDFYYKYENEQTIFSAKDSKDFADYTVMSFYEDEYDYGMWRNGIVTDIVGDNINNTNLEDQINISESVKKFYNNTTTPIKFENSIWINGTFNSTGKFINSVFLNGIWKKGNFNDSSFNPFVPRWDFNLPIDSTNVGVYKYELSDSCLWEGGLLDNSNFDISEWRKGTFKSGDMYGAKWTDGVADNINAYNCVWNGGVFKNGNWNGTDFDLSDIYDVNLKSYIDEFDETVKKGFPPKADVFVFYDSISLGNANIDYLKNLVTEWENGYRISTSSDGQPWEGNLYQLVTNGYGDSTVSNSGISEIKYTIDFVKTNNPMERWLAYPGYTKEILTNPVNAITQLGIEPLTSVEGKDIVVIGFIDEAQSDYHSSPIGNSPLTSNLSSPYDAFKQDYENFIDFYNEVSSFYGLVYTPLKYLPSYNIRLTFMEHVVASIEGTSITNEIIDDIEENKVNKNLERTNQWVGDSLDFINVLRTLVGGDNNPYNPNNIDDYRSLRSLGWDYNLERWSKSNGDVAMPDSSNMTGDDFTADIEDFIENAVKNTKVEGEFQQSKSRKTSLLFKQLERNRLDTTYARVSNIVVSNYTKASISSETKIEDEAIYLRAAVDDKNSGFYWNTDLTTLLSDTNQYLPINNIGNQLNISSTSSTLLDNLQVSGVNFDNDVESYDLVPIRLRNTPGTNLIFNYENTNIKIGTGAFIEGIWEDGVWNNGVWENNPYFINGVNDIYQPGKLTGSDNFAEINENGFWNGDLVDFQNISSDMNDFTLSINNQDVVGDYAVYSNQTYPKDSNLIIKWNGDSDINNLSDIIIGLGDENSNIPNDSTNINIGVATDDTVGNQIGKVRGFKNGYFFGEGFTLESNELYFYYQGGSNLVRIFDDNGNEIVINNVSFGGSTDWPLVSNFSVNGTPVTTATDFGFTEDNQGLLYLHNDNVNQTYELQILTDYDPAYSGYYVNPFAVNKDYLREPNEFNPNLTPSGLYYDNNGVIEPIPSTPSYKYVKAKLDPITGFLDANGYITTINSKTASQYNSTTSIDTEDPSEVDYPLPIINNSDGGEYLKELVVLVDPNDADFSKLTKYTTVSNANSNKFVIDSEVQINNGKTILDYNQNQSTTINGTILPNNLVIFDDSPNGGTITPITDINKFVLEDYVLENEGKTVEKYNIYPGTFIEGLNPFFDTPLIGGVDPDFEQGLVEYDNNTDTKTELNPTFFDKYVIEQGVKSNSGFDERFNNLKPQNYNVDSDGSKGWVRNGIQQLSPGLKGVTTLPDFSDLSNYANIETYSISSFLNFEYVYEDKVLPNPGKNPSDYNNPAPGSIGSTPFYGTQTGLVLIELGIQVEKTITYLSVTDPNKYVVEHLVQDYVNLKVEDYNTVDWTDDNSVTESGLGILIGGVLTHISNKADYVEETKVLYDNVRDIYYIEDVSYHDANEFLSGKCIAKDIVIRFDTIYLTNVPYPEYYIGASIQTINGVNVFSTKYLTNAPYPYNYILDKDVALTNDPYPFNYITNINQLTDVQYPKYYITSESTGLTDSSLSYIDGLDKLTNEPGYYIQGNLDDSITSEPNAEVTTPTTGDIRIKVDVLYQGEEVSDNIEIYQSETPMTNTDIIASISGISTEFPSNINNQGESFNQYGGYFIEVSNSYQTDPEIWVVDITTNDPLSVANLNVGDKVSIGNVIGVTINETRKLLKDKYTIIDKREDLLNEIYTLSVSVKVTFPIRRVDKDSENHMIVVSKRVWEDGTFHAGLFEGVWNSGKVEGNPFTTELRNTHFIDGEIEGGKITSIIRDNINNIEVDDFSTTVLQNAVIYSMNTSGSDKFGTWLDINWQSEFVSLDFDEDDLINYTQMSYPTSSDVLSGQLAIWEGTTDTTNRKLYSMSVGTKAELYDDLVFDDFNNVVLPERLEDRGWEFYTWNGRLQTGTSSNDNNEILTSIEATEFGPFQDIYTTTNLVRQSYRRYHPYNNDPNHFHTYTKNNYIPEDAMRYFPGPNKNTNIGEVEDNGELVVFDFKDVASLIKNTGEPNDGDFPGTSEAIRYRYYELSYDITKIVGDGLNYSHYIQNFPHFGYKDDWKGSSIPKEWTWQSVYDTGEQGEFNNQNISAVVTYDIKYLISELEPNFVVGDEVVMSHYTEGTYTIKGIYKFSDGFINEEIKNPSAFQWAVELEYVAYKDGFGDTIEYDNEGFCYKVLSPINEETGFDNRLSYFFNIKPDNFLSAIGTISPTSSIVDDKYSYESLNASLDNYILQEVDRVPIYDYMNSSILYSMGYNIPKSINKEVKIDKKSEAKIKPPFLTDKIVIDRIRPYYRIPYKPGYTRFANWRRPRFNFRVFRL